MEADESGGPAALNGSEVEVVGKFLAVECFLVGLHDVREVRVACDFG